MLLCILNQKNPTFFGLSTLYLHNKFKRTKTFVFVSNLFCILGRIFYTIYYLYYLSSAYISLLIQDELQYSVEFANIAYLVFSIALVLFLPF